MKVALLALFLLSACAAPARMGVRSVSVCVEYSADHALDDNFRRARRLGASSCVELAE